MTKEKFCKAMWIEWEMTNRESEVAWVVYNSPGSSNSILAAAMNMSINTLKTHLKHIFRRLEVKSRTEMYINIRNYIELREKMALSNEENTSLGIG